MNKDNKIFVCKRMRVLNHLVNAGFEPFETIVDANNINYKNWLFERTEALTKTLDDYFANKVYE
jgi:hypothetical protein